MYPELFEIPFIHVTLRSFGLMMVLSFLAAVWLIRHLSRNITPEAHVVTNGALYALIAAVVGARLFYVVHYLDDFKEDTASVFAIWNGGLELMGVVLAIVVIVLYLWRLRLPMRRYLDIVAIGLMLALFVGRLGCFLNGCCFGKPTGLAWGVRFPYGSFVYSSQVRPDLRRCRDKAHMELPEEFFGYASVDGTAGILRSYEDLTAVQKAELKATDTLRSLAVHPTQLYSSANGAVLCLVLYLFWRRSQNADNSKGKRFCSNPGCTFGLMLVLYGVTRFFIEALRDDNPYEYGWWAIYRGGTISQNLGVYAAILGAVLMVVFHKMAPDELALKGSE